MANISEALFDWSNTGGSNQPDSGDSATIQADLQAIQAGVRGWLAHKGSDIASVAGTTDIGAVEGLAHDITGAETITGFGTVSAGIWKILKFEGAATLTHNATSLILPGGANITAANGDIGIFISEGSGNWRCVIYSRTASAPLAFASNAETLTGTSTVKAVTPAGLESVLGMVKLTGGSVSAAATLDLDLSTYTAFPHKLLVLTNWVPATDGASLLARVSTNGGSSYDTGAGNYGYHLVSGDMTAGTVDHTAGTDSSIVVASAAGNAAGEAIYGARIFMFSTTTAQKPSFTIDTLFQNSAGDDASSRYQWMRLAAQDTDAFRLLFSSGNITSGDWVLYGMNI